MSDPSSPGFYKYTDDDIAALKGTLASRGGVWIGYALAKAAVEKGFIEGVHFHVIKPIPQFPERRWPPSYVKTGIYPR